MLELGLELNLELGLEDLQFQIGFRLDLWFWFV